MSETATTPFRASNPVDSTVTPRKQWYLHPAVSLGDGDDLASWLLCILAFGACLWALWIVGAFIVWAWGAWAAQLRFLAALLFGAIVWSLAFVRYGVKS